jgi:hypothetical protein
MPVLENELGRRMSAEEVANYLGLDEKTVRQYHRELGGMRLGRLFLFFERSVLNALQKRTEMDCPSAEGWEETGKGISDTEGSDGLGNQDAPKSTRRMEREDRHGLLK